MEHRLHLRLEIRPHDRLGHPIRHGGHAEDAHALAPCLGYLHRPDRRREVRSRGHAIPELVEIPLQVLSNSLIDTSSTPGAPWLALTFW
jgi:hypothetical protein